MNVSIYTCPQCGSEVTIKRAGSRVPNCPDCGTLMGLFSEEPKKSMTGIFTGLEIEVPKDIQELLIPGEKVLHAVRQARIEQAIMALPGIENVSCSPGNEGDSVVFTVHYSRKEDLRARLSRAVMDGGGDLLEIRTHGMTLEDIFIRCITTDEKGVPTDVA